MNKEEFTILLQASLFRFDGVSSDVIYNRLSEIYPNTRKFIHAGIKLGDYCRSK